MLVPKAAPGIVCFDAGCWCLHTCNLFIQQGEENQPGSWMACPAKQL